MSRPVFSKDYRTYGEWLKAQPRESRYAKEIIKKHNLFPDKSLNQLRNLRIADYDISKMAWGSLTSQQKSDRQLSLEILRTMRKGGNLTQITEKLGVNRQFALKNLGNYLYKDKGKWAVTATDKIETQMLFYSRDKGQISIVTASSKDRSLIGKYMAYVNKALKHNDPSVLDEFKNLKIVDAEGKEHYFETDLDKLYEIAEAQEEPEFLEIYQS